jgi:mono/diheme cytochrome c family protein
LRSVEWPGNSWRFSTAGGNGAVLAPDPAGDLKVILLGIPTQYRRVPMPAFAGHMSDQQIADLAKNCVRTSWGNTATPDATGSMVSTLRAR